MRLAPDLERINLSILNGAFDLADSELLNLSATTLAEKRTKAHFKAIVTFRRGDVARAKQQMESVLQEYGENVNLLRDLLVCQYHLQDMGGFRLNLARFEDRLKAHQDHLSQRTLLECELMAGKFLEEEARVVPALEFYDRALSRASMQAHRLRALVQKARWYALYSPNQTLSELYRELIRVSHEKMTHDLHVELEHSLMLIELRLVGVDHAWQRVTRLTDFVDPRDQRELCFDFIEGVLAQDLEIAPEVRELMNAFKNLTPFEQFIVKIVNGSLEAADKLHELSLLATCLPWSCYLRLLCMVANRDVSNSIRHELHRKIQLLIRALDPSSQKVWNQCLKQTMQTPEICLEYSSQSRAVVIHGRRVDLSKKKFGMQLLEGLAARAELSVDEAIALLWQTSFSPEHYHRLRMSVHRLNMLINKVTGMGKIIEVDSQTVRLRPEVRIQRVPGS